MSESYWNSPPPPPTPPVYGWGAPTLPDGVEIASVGRRVGAWFLSILLFLVTLGIGWMIWGLVVWRKGTSPALQVLGMRAWKQDAVQDRPAGWGDMALRNGLEWLISTFTCNISSIVSFVMFLSDEPRHRTIGDHVATTVIVYDPQKRLG